MEGRVTNEICVSSPNDETSPTILKETPKRYLPNNSLVRNKTPHSKQKVDANSHGFACGSCGIIFKRKDSLRRHTLSSHKRRGLEKPYLCSVCNDSFTRKDNLKRHEANHQKKKGQTAKVKRLETSLKRQTARSKSRRNGKSQGFVCDICNVVVKTQWSLKRHKSASHTLQTEKPFQCSICKAGFKRKDSLRRHEANVKHKQVSDESSLGWTMAQSKVRVHDNSKGFACVVCGAVLKTHYNLKRHKLVSHTFKGTEKGKKPFHCTFCKDSFVRKDLFRRHEASHKRSFVCTICDAVFKGKVHLKMHQLVHGKENLKSSEKSLLHLNGQQTIPSVIRRKHYCGNCGVYFSSSWSLKRHLVTHISGQTKRKRFSCTVCKACFTRKEHLKVHQAIHTRNTSLVCDLCDVGFLTNYQLKLHQRRHANKRKVYACHTCGKSLATASELSKHVGVHMQTEPCVCEICGSHFSSNGILKRHQLVHSDARCYVCDICGKGFKDLSHLKRHQLTHSTEKPYLCHVCGRGFKQKFRLSQHSMVHTKEKPWLCTTCGKKFSTKVGLQLHEKSHTKERPHVCNICGDAFVHKHHLKNHLGAHSNERPFVCTVCDKAFLLKHQLQAHMKTHINVGK